MARSRFTTSGMRDEKMVGRPASVKKSGGVLPPGATLVDGFDAAKNFARGGTAAPGVAYSPLSQPGRVATRIAWPDSQTGFGLGDL
jgi:hypothetical protein